MHGTLQPEELAQTLGDRPQAEAVLDLAVGPPEVAGQDHPGALAEEGPDRRDRRPDPRVVGDLAVLERDVEVDPDEDALAGRVDVADGELVHVGWAASAQATPAGIRSAT